MVSKRASTRIQEHIHSIPLGTPFTPAALLFEANRASVDQALCRLTKAGVLTRLARGLYVRPETNRFVGVVMPDPLEIAQAIAQRTGAVVTPQGAESARRLSLTTQVSNQTVFWTSGRSRKLRIGQTEIVLKRVGMRKLALAGTAAGQAMAAMWYLGKNGFNQEASSSLRKQLVPEEYERLKSAVESMPAWMSGVLFSNEHAGRSTYA